MVREPASDCCFRRNSQSSGLQDRLPVVAVLKLAEIMPPAATGLPGVSEPAKATPPTWPIGLPVASLASIVTRPWLVDVPPITSAVERCGWP